MTLISGEMVERIKAFDWSATSIGPRSGWPARWRDASEYIVDSGFPAALALGPDWIYLYNDAFIALGGPARHPWALGRPVKEVWREIWPYLESNFQQTLSTGRSIIEIDRLMPLVRSGYLEETYMRFSFAVVRDDSNTPSGILCTATENTELIVTRRQTDCLRRLAANCAAADSPREACRLAAVVLEEQERDVPFALLYLFDPDSGALELTASAGLGADPGDRARHVPLEAAGDPWRLIASSSRGEPADIEDVAHLLRAASRTPDPAPQRAIALPVSAGTPGAPCGVLVGGINPMRPVAESRQFYEFVATHLEKALGRARMKQLAEEQARDLAALDRAKTVFFSNVSHELRTPLTLVLGPLRQVLEGARLEPEHREALEVGYQAASRLQKLINSLLEFSRVEAGREDAHYQPTDLAGLTTDLAEMFRSVLEHEKIALLVDCPSLPEPAYVDPEMWTTIVHNLLSNAFKFTLTGQVTVRLDTHRDQFELEIADTGCGIAEDDLPRVFQRFAPVRAARARTLEGSGIGLSLAQELTRLHGGRIEVSSELGVGTCFRVCIPRGSAHLPQDRVTDRPSPPQREADPYLNEALGWLEDAVKTPPALQAPETGASVSAVGSPEAAREPRPRGTARERVLVVDDNAQMRLFLSRLLRDRWQVETEADGAAALEHIRRDTPDVVVADVMMPRMDGIQMLQALRAEAGIAEVPVLLLSARAGEEASVEGLHSGANDYLVKPFSKRELVARIEVLLAQARQRAAERLARTQAEQNVRAREEFFAALVHELRAPVSSLFSWLEVLQSEKLTRSSILGSLEALELAAKSLRRLSEDLYDIARATSRPMPVAPRVFASIAPLIAAVVEAFAPAASKKRIALHPALESDSGPASVDPERLQQIVSNLLSNAIRFTPAHGRIDVTCARRAQEIELRVSDSGRGIAADALPHVFERYWQGRRASDDGGLGLGLSICRRLVERHGGRIEALSAGEGRGATFVIRFPLAGERPQGRPARQAARTPARVRDAALAAERLAEQQGARDGPAS